MRNDALLAFLGAFCAAASGPTRPNIVFILTDDQDQVLGASFPLTSEATPMPKTKRLMQDQGMHASNWYIHTPVCSPSRSELLTGRYFHNIKQVGGTGYCSGMHVNYTTVNENTFGKILKEEAGYATGMFGKYVNEMPMDAPPGWDAWLANGGGDYIAPKFQTKGIDGLPDGHVNFTSDPANYTTAVVGNKSIAWIRKVAKEGKPFMAYIAPKAAHEPFNPAPWYRDHWEESWPRHEPQGDNWNCSSESRKDHHGNIATEPMITRDASKIITGVFKNRWRTLMSVDDLIADVIGEVEKLGLLNSTYFFYSSDHGFQLGQFNIPMDKRHVYEWDTKIHLLARGPGIPAGSVMSAPGTQVDIAPTLLGLAGLGSKLSHDGKSVAPFLLQDTESTALLEATQKHLREIGDLDAYMRNWRTEVFIEMFYCSYNVKCTENCPRGDYPHADSNCANLANNTDCWCNANGPSKGPTCYETEDPTNNFIAIRTFDDDRNTLYAEFQTGDQAYENIDFSKIDFIEYYNVDADPFQMHNLIGTTANSTAEALHERVQRWAHCAGPSCEPALWKLAADSIVI